MIQNIKVDSAHVKLLGDAAAGYVLAECIRLSNSFSGETPKKIANELGWFYKLEEDWESIGITARVWRRVKKQLQELGVLEAQFIGLPPRMWMRINFNQLEALLKETK